MLMKVEPLYKSLQNLSFQFPVSSFQTDAEKKKNVKKKTRVILLSARGKKWNQQLAQKFSELENLVFICGRYEGVDERIKKFIDEEISIGDYVLTGGELCAAVMIDSITRLLPGSLGNSASAIDESHSIPGQLEYPQYTKPEVVEINGKKMRVPKVLLSGHHEKIAKWRKSKMKTSKS